METQSYVRRSFPIEAVQVTDGNFDEVLAWTGGTAKVDEDGKRYISVAVDHPRDEEQTRAYVGKWVLKLKGFKVFNDRGFQKNYKLDRASSQPTRTGGRGPNLMQAREGLSRVARNIVNNKDESPSVAIEENVFDKPADSQPVQVTVDPRDAISAKR